MQKPSLVILAAGMGSRYGGLKQIDPVDEYGNILIDYSIYDALRIGFEHIVCIIKKEIEEDFYEAIGRRIEKKAKVTYAYQELDKLPSGYSIPEGRVKPWGTAHAILCTKGLTDGPFVVINADDFYGYGSYAGLFEYYKAGNYGFSMMAYDIEKTLTLNGEVTRAICKVEDSYLSSIEEISGIMKAGLAGVYLRDGEHVFIPTGTAVSMNMWGFTQDIYPMIEDGFKRFLEQELPDNPLKCEYLLPTAVEEFITGYSAKVRVLKSGERWFGVTYREDMPMVKSHLRQLKDKKFYSERLWR